MKTTNKEVHCFHVYMMAAMKRIIKSSGRDDGKMLREADERNSGVQVDNLKAGLWI